MQDEDTNPEGEADVEEVAGQEDTTPTEEGETPADVADEEESNGDE